MSPADRARHDALAKALADQGRLIEAGFIAMRATMISPDASEAQVSEMRLAFMGGAQHLFASIMSVLDPDSGPTAADLRRMSLIASELNAFERELKLRVAPTGGSA